MADSASATGASMAEAACATPSGIFERKMTWLSETGGAVAVAFDVEAGVELLGQGLDQGGAEAGRCRRNADTG